MQLCQGKRGFAIGFHWHLSNELDVRGMHDRDRMNMRPQGIIQVIGVGRHFQDQRILRGQGALNPCLKLITADPLGSEHDGFGRIYTDRDQIVFVDIQANKAGRR
jgi:hypothetical protein